MKRRPPKPRMAAKPQPIFETFDQISPGPARHTKYANSPSPSSAKAAPAGANLPDPPPALTSRVIGKRARPARLLTCAARSTPLIFLRLAVARYAIAVPRHNARATPRAQAFRRRGRVRGARGVETFNALER